MADRTKDRMSPVRGWVLLHDGKRLIFETVSRKQFVQNWEPLQEGETVMRAEVRVVKRRNAR